MHNIPSDWSFKDTENCFNSTVAKRYVGLPPVSINVRENRRDNQE